MSILGKKFPAPVAQPMWPFYTAGVIILYGINSCGNLLANSESMGFKNDPRNTSAKTPKPADKRS